MVCRKRSQLSLANDPSSSGWQRLSGGSWTFSGKLFADERGKSCETCDLSNAPFAALKHFPLAQENLINNKEAGCARGLHYQNGAFAQPKLVTLLQGSAQLFWLPLGQTSMIAEVHSIVLSSPGQSLYTPSDCAHGLLALENDTLFLLKMASPIAIAERREIRLVSDRLSVTFARPIRLDLQSARDRDAPHWSPRSSGD